MFGMAQAPVMITEIGEDYITEPNSLADPDNPVYYAIKCNSQQSFNTWMFDNGDTPKGGQASSDPTQLSNAGTYVWEIVPVEGKEGYYTFKNYSTGNYINIIGTSNGGAVEMSADEVETYITLGEGDYEDYIALRNPNATGQWIDMGWSGAGISTWSGGVGGSRRMQIFEVTLEEGDEHQGAVDNLTTVIDNVSGDLDTWAEDLGEDRWQHKQDLYDAFSEALEEANAILEDPDSYTTAEINAAKDKLQKTHDDCANNVNGATQQAYDNGYYMIVSALTFTGDITKYYTAEEAEAKNEENLVADENGVNPGEEGYITTYAEDYTPVAEGDPYTESGDVIKAMYEDAGTAKWMTYQKKAQFLFKLEQTTPTYVAPNTDASKVYKVTNMLNLHTFGHVTTSAAVPMSACDSLFTFDIVPGEVRTDNEYPVVDIRNAGLAEGQYYYLHCGGHGGGSGTSGNIVGWCDNNDAAATRWYLQPISDEEAEEWLKSDEAQASLMIAEMKPYVSNIPGQVETSKDETTTVDLTQPLITDASQFSSPYTTLDEQATTEEQIFENLISSEETSTYWHSAWESGSVAQDVHYLQVAVPDDVTFDGTQSYTVRITRRPVSGDQITKLDVRGYADNDESLGFEDGTDLGSVVLPMGSSNSETLNGTTLFTPTAETRYLRFYSAAEVAFSSGGGASRGYWHCRKFQVYPAEVGYYYGSYENTQYAKRQTLADAATAAIDAWNASAWNADSVAAGKQTLADLTESYNTLKTAAEAWKAVYVDPANLRTALATAKPNVEMIVKGNNPGEWAEGTDADALKTVYDNALAYDKSGEYAPATSKEHIANLANTTTNVLAQANKIVANKWYKIHFAPESLYETAGWDKTGAKAAYAKYDDQQTEEAGEGDQDVTVSKALFGRYLTTGKANSDYSEAVVRHQSEEEGGEAYEDSIVIYRPIYNTDAVAGHNIIFADADEDQMPALFRFIEATDSTYYIQNKETGLYLANNSNNKVVLSASPYTFNATAMGWGACLINAFSIDGKKVAPIHGERATNLLVTWDATTLGSNSMMFIENTDEEGEPASTDFTMEMWPGQLYAYTFTGDVTLSSTENLDIYTKAGFEVIEDTKTNMITLDKTQFSGNVLKAGVPYIIRTKLDEGTDYVSLANAQTAAKQAAAEEKGEDLTRAEMKEANEKAWNENVVTVSATHATSDFVNEAQTSGKLIGTISAVSDLESNTAATVSENTFKKASACGILSAYVDITGLKNVYSLKWQEGTIGLKGDLNGDGTVDFVDLGILIDNINLEKETEGADLNNDGVVDIVDLGILIDIINSQSN